MEKITHHQPTVELEDRLPDNGDTGTHLGGDPQGFTILKVIFGDEPPEALKHPWHYDPDTKALTRHLTDEERAARAVALEQSRLAGPAPRVREILQELRQEYEGSTT